MVRDPQTAEIARQGRCTLAGRELPVGKKADQLREDGAALIHEPLSALLAFKSRQARNGFNLLRSCYLQPAPCQLTGQQWSRTAIHTRTAWQEQFIGIADPITSPSDERYVAAAILVTPKPDKSAPTQQDVPAVRGVSINTLRSRNFALERLPGTAIEVKSIADLFWGGLRQWKFAPAWMLRSRN